MVPCVTHWTYLLTGRMQEGAMCYSLDLSSYREDRFHVLLTGPIFLQGGCKKVPCLLTGPIFLQGGCS